MAAATLASPDAAAAMDDRRLMELLIMMVAIHSLLRKEGAANDDDAGELKDMVRELSMSINRGGGDQSAVSKELLLAITQRLLDEQQQLRLSDDGGENEGRAAAPSSASDHQLMETAAAAKKKEKAAAAAKMKKKRNKRNKAAAKRQGTKRMSWLAGGIISLLMMAGSITTFITLSHGSSEGNKAPPTLPPSTSTSLRQRDLQSSDNVASMSPASVSPFAVVVQAPIFSPTPSSSPTTSSSPTVSASPTELCFDTPNYEDMLGFVCKDYEYFDVPGCPNEGSLYEGNMGVANDNCCYCGGGSHTLSPTTSPKPSSSPTKSATPSSSPSSAPSMCTDTEGWYDAEGYDCSWYEVVDDPGCPQYGDLHWKFTFSGVANDNCCYCKNDAVSTVSPTKAPSSSGTCVDTPGWKNSRGDGCEWYQEWDDPGCPDDGNRYTGEMGPAADNCCYCKNPTCERGDGCEYYQELYDPGCFGYSDGNSYTADVAPCDLGYNCCYCKHPTCEDFKWKCQYYTTNNVVVNNNGWWKKDPDRVKNMCDRAASSCCKTADHVKVVTYDDNWSYYNETVGLYDECKCDFWLRLCEHTRGGDACDYAAEYCCGDYKCKYYGETFDYLNSPLCYCDFFNYAQNEFGHTLKPKALNMNIEFPNPCGQGTFPRDTVKEKLSLVAIYNATNGRNWTNNDGWMNETVDHCQWYGISCDDKGKVTGIDLKDNNLEGQFPVYTRNVYTDWGTPILDSYWEETKYGLANLYSLKTLDLSNNKLTGTIEYAPLYNLNALTHFDVSGNQLSGEIDTLVAPSLLDAYFSSNNFTTMHRFQKYKASFHTLRYCDVSNNAIQEDAADILENIPSNIVQFIASNNQINGSLPASVNNLQKLRQFNMASNTLSGKLPGFTESFATLQELDVSNQTNGFTGSIPENIWRSLSLKILNLAGNKLTGTIPPLVGNLAVLEVFDLSNNLLESSIPAELGMLDGSLKRLVLSNNTFSGSIPSQIGQLQVASVFLKDNGFRNNSAAPLILCMEREVKEFDLADDITFCPPERNALSDFYYSAKGAEWTDEGNKIDGSQWLDEYASYCDWKGVTCDDDKNHVTKLNLTNNGLSGRLSESIGNLTFIEVMDLSDNDIKGSIPTEIGLLKNLKYLRLSYNAFTGAAPEGLGEVKGLQLLQLQSNRITEMPIIPRLNNSIFGQSTFVTDCGVPSAFDEALECKNCTMCCNANDDCHPQEESQVAPLNYSTLTAVLFVCFILFCCIVTLLLYEYDRRKNRGITLTMSMETRIKEDDNYALSKIGKDSVYSYFVTDKVFGWLGAFATVGMQIGILFVFIVASEAKLQDDKSDIQYTWKCSRDTDVCEDKSDLENLMWAIFCVLMVAFLAKDMISGSKLIYHSAKGRHSLSSRIRYFFGGMCLCWITLFALYVSTVYNKAIATRNTELILNSVVVLFIMDMDEWIFSTLEAINKKWTAHAADGSEDTSSDVEARSGGIIAEMKEEMTRQSEQIASQQEQITSQQEDLRKLREIVEKLQDSQAAAAAAAAAKAASDSESVSDCEGETKAHQMEQTDEITMPFDGEQNMQEPRAAADTPDSHLESDTEEDLQE